MFLAAVDKASTVVVGIFGHVAHYVYGFLLVGHVGLLYELRQVVPGGDVVGAFYDIVGQGDVFAHIFLEGAAALLRQLAVYGH